ncbi:hypothetical protein J1N35_034300 [Gossypium stocksii]|uniref:Small ribosomal subunit protein uS10 domain-containing protein n=1 Tax=Gossypium stocksii TaxID=47602 RepID=A0A9D3URS5_9ROSI|nr:hypothetical protein J1N35_034300 [Gossypium stocksii]
MQRQISFLSFSLSQANLIPLLKVLVKLPNSSLKHSQSTTKIFAAPKALEETLEVGGSEVPTTSVSVEANKAAPKQNIRIKLRSYWVPLIEDSCKQILDATWTTNAKTMGPVPLPTKKMIYCVLKSPHVHKDARFHFEIQTHQRLVDILYPTAQTIDSLMQLDLILYIVPFTNKESEKLGEEEKGENDLLRFPFPVVLSKKNEAQQQQQQQLFLSSIQSSSSSSSDELHILHPVTTHTAAALPSTFKSKHSFSTL